jgi:hypothetical protein
MRMTLQLSSVHLIPLDRLRLGQRPLVIELGCSTRMQDLRDKGEGLHVDKNDVT